MSKIRRSPEKRLLQRTDLDTGETRRFLEQSQGEGDFIPVKAPYLFVSKNDDWYLHVSATACRVGLHLMKTMKIGGYVLKTRSVIAKELGLRRDTVGRAVKELERTGLIRIEEAGFTVNETKAYEKPRSKKRGKPSVA